MKIREKTFSEMLLKDMQSRRMTKESLAGAAGLSVDTIRKALHGQCLSRGSRALIAVALGFEADHYEGLSEGEREFPGDASFTPREKARGRHPSLTEFQPKTQLAKKLWKLRVEHVKSGARLLSWDEIEIKKAEARGDS
jgi:transcriptional regulator with XRE-family HTH domain